MERVHHSRPPTRRQVLGDASRRVNQGSSPQHEGKAHQIDNNESSPPSHLPHNESLVPNGSLAVRHQPQLSPENKRISAVINDESRPHNPKRDSEISNTSTNASSTGRRRKTHIGPWQLGKTIGRGGCSRVRIVRHSMTGQYGAAKIISKATAEKVRALSLANLIKSAEEEPSMFPGGKVIPFGLEREIVIMKLLDHPNIVHLYDVWENRNELYLIMEHIQGGELFNYIGEQGGIQEVEVVHLFRQIIAALLYCHRLNIHHRDLKPENILLDRKSWEIKLVDFGMAALQPVGKKLTTPCGSPHYAAPEVIRTQSYDGGRADVWSCGVILYVMLYGAPPFNYSGDDRDLKHLFRAIAHADYVMPDTLSREAQDLIRRILVPDPKRRIPIEAIWDHPFLRKYDAGLGFQGDMATMAHWVGPTPEIKGWTPLEWHTIDREILRNLRTLWHSEKEDVLVQRLLSKEGNQEKYFYSALLRHREEQLENYAPSPNAVGYSNSDHHHHAKIDPSAGDLLQLPSNKHKRSQSAYSILNDEHLYSKHSFYEPPSSDVSYDPFRASRDPIIPGQALHRNVTVHRGGSDSESRRMRPVTALGHRTGSSLRIQALKNSKQRSSNLSHNSSKRSTPSQRSSLAARRRSMSRSSMASSHWPSSPPVIVRPGSIGRRGVNFSHLRRSSGSEASTTPYTPEQRRLTIRSRESGGSSTISPPPSLHVTPAARLVAKVAVNPMVPRLRVRKPESPSKYIQSEARKVSCELEKVMEEAFNRSSMSETVRTSVTDQDGEPIGYETPPTSFSNRGSGASTIATPNNRAMLKNIQNRPLPPLPSETPNTFLQRKLAETREELAKRLDEDPDNTGHFEEVLEHLDRLMQPNTAGAKRASSAPTKSPECPGLLPVISEEVRDSEDRFGTYSSNYRAVTDPIRPTLHGRRAMTEQQTIRVVENSPTSIAPLNIRKRSGARSNPPPRTYQSVHNELLATRPNDGGPSRTVTPAVSEKKEATITKKKSSWFRRTTEEKERLSENQPRPETGARLMIPEAWQSLDDRIKPEHPASKMASGAFPGLAKHTSKQSGASSEFPMRNRNSTIAKGEGTGGRKGFLGLFGKKAKEDKGKKLMELGSTDLSSSSLLSGGFDLAPGSNDGVPIRPPELQMNWLSRFLHIKPANKILCFQIGRGKVRQDLVRLLRDWQRFGVRDVSYDRKSNSINAHIDKNNHLKIKPVSLVIELFVVLEHGRRANLCLARFTQTRGAASSFRKVVDIVENVCRARSMLVEDEDKKSAMCEVLS
ncbi:Pkinase-domain-containing protein [Lindgomyces ingoldianus]|uniref:Pkinase-domain-containing protein n=1 Tax=Lindgomyces ingoldianus TaxID=673940 RepID=A0ACB6QG70_9PLEO|nr:Pkinase-domain-containing protein [Lindgomyces ingoldianus]KAF2465924.1 Pkinase-domain-containing protein [Lindgomyces ingoldianus]